jgi:hypothetical protein
MKPVCRVFVISSLVLVLAHPLSLSAQWNKKPYTEWSEREAMKLLNDSPWCQTKAVTLQQAIATLYKLTTNELKNVCYLLVDGSACFFESISRRERTGSVRASSFRGWWTESPSSPRKAQTFCFTRSWAADPRWMLPSPTRLSRTGICQTAQLTGRLRRLDSQSALVTT